MATALTNDNKDWLSDRNHDGVHDFRDLTTISERIRYLKDTNGDGKADLSTVFADGFQEEFTGVAAGVLPVDGNVLFTVYPDLWKLADTDGDHRSDQRESMFRGFGVHAAFDGHDLHGLTIGPEGKVYFSCGDNGFSVVTKEGKRLHHPNTGGVLRMNRDGSDLEVFAIGLRNVQEFDFDQYGNMFAVDNDGDLEDERERAVYIAEGSDSGWRLNWQFRSNGWKAYNGGMAYNPWTAEGMWKTRHADQPAYITPPMQNYSVGPGGFKFNPGTCLNDGYRDFFFCIQFPVAKITAFRTQANGAGFKMSDEHLFHGGLMASSVNFGPDGGLYIADWLGKWSPNKEGVIYRLDDPRVQTSKVRREVQELLLDGVADKTSIELSKLLGHADRRVRQLAQSELVRRQHSSYLLQLAAKQEQPKLGRIHAIWGLIQLGSEGVEVEHVADKLPWSDEDYHIRQQCARAAGDLRIRESVSSLSQLLSDPVAIVQSHAAIALGKIGNPNVVDDLIALAERNGDSDPFIRHAVVMGLAGCGSGDRLAQFAAHPNSAVRMVAVLALRRQRSSHIEAFLTDRDIAVLREAIRAIHDDFSIEESLPKVAELLDSDLPDNEPIVRRVLSANLRIGTAECAERLARFILRPNCFEHSAIGEEMQIEAMTCLAVWDQVPLVDRVEGRIRHRKKIDAAVGRASLAKYVDRVFSIAGPRLTTEATRIAKNLKLPVSLDNLQSRVLSAAEPTDTRIESLRAINAQDAEIATALALRLTADSARRLRHAAFEVLLKNDKSQAWEVVQHEWPDAPTADQQLFISMLPKFKSSNADEKLHSLLKSLCDGYVSPAISLDVISAARKKPARFAKLLEMVDTKQKTKPLGKFQWSAFGGDPARGEQVYKGHVAAQCVRCHDAGGQGKQAGPVLDSIASRVDRAYLLDAIVRPSAKIAEGYDSVTVVLDDGRVVNGSVIRESETDLVIATAEAKIVTIDQGEIDERQTNSVSAMPEMGKILTASEVRDLVAYLSTLKSGVEE